MTLDFETVTGTITKVSTYNEQTGFFIARVNSDRHGRIGFKGMAVFEPQVGVLVSAVGVLTKHEKFGLQLDALKKGSELTFEPPVSYEARTRYIRALAPFLSYDDAQTVARSKVDLTKTLVPGIPRDQAEIFRTAWNGRIASTRSLQQVQEWGMRSAVAIQVVRHFAEQGEDAYRVGLTNPYRFIEAGVDFGSADRLAQKLGWSTDCNERIVAGLAEAARRPHYSGSTVLTERDLCSKTVKILEPHGAEDDYFGDLPQLDAPTYDRIRALIPAATENGYIALRQLPAGTRYQSPQYFRAEQALANEVRRLNKSRTTLVVPSAQMVEERFGFRPDESQMQAVDMVFERGISIITGGPGCGKTKTLEVVANFFPGERILLAPTGMAANRLKDATGLRATTIHKFLGAKSVSGPGDRFTYTKRNPVPIAENSLVVVDEMSMVDVVTASALFAALPPKTRVVLVGDSDQLSSVDPGDVLADLMLNNVPTTRLRFIHRTTHDSPIPAAARDMIEGRVPVLPDARSTPGLNLRHLEVAEDSCGAEVVKVVAGMKRAGMSSTDVRVLTPMRDGFFGELSLNEELQRVWVPEPKGRQIVIDFEVNGNSYKQRIGIGDRIMATEGRFGKSDVFNGMTFDVIGVEHDALILKPDGAVDPALYDPNDAIITLEGRQNYNHVRLAYATTIHKAQGSEYKCVVLALSEREHRRMLNRKLIYTAMTRARQHLTVVGNRAAVMLAAQDAGSMTIRETGLSEFLSEAQSPRLKLRVM